MALEDCVFPFRKASIGDFKIGKKFYEEGTDESKVLRTRVKYSVLDTTGFQIVGMRVSILLVSLGAFNAFPALF